MPDRGHRPSPIVRRALLAVGGLWWLAACGETVTQIDPSDIVGLRVSADSARVGVGRLFDLDAFPLDGDGALLVGQDVAWTSTNTAIATVTSDGVVAGVSVGTAHVVAQIVSLGDTTFVTVVAPPVLVLSADSVGFVATAGGANPPPDTIAITNGGVLDLELRVDSIVPVAGATGWLAAQLDRSTAPANLVLTPISNGITTAGTNVAIAWISGLEAEDSPAAVQVTLRITAANPATMTVNDGNNQSSTVGGAVTVAPSVLVEDAFGNPAAGATVNFAVTGGSGSLAGNAPAVDSMGIARLGSWTLGTQAGPNQLTATLGILAPVVFSATGTPGNATQIVVAGGDNQSAVAGNAVGVPPSVAIQDQFGNGVAGVQVTFAVTSGGGGVTGASQTSAGVGGTATVGSWTLGIAAGANTLSATAAGVGTPAVFTATGLTGAADSMFAQAGDTQTDTVAATLPVAYSVRVVDSNGNGVEGIPITWTVTGGGGSITPSSNTDALGFATAVRVLGTAPGGNTATASVGGLGGSPVQFTATANVGSPAAITVTAGAQTDTVNLAVAIAPQVRVTDKFDNPIEGNPVTFQVTGGGGIVSPTTAIATLADGTATVTSWQLGTVAGPSNNTLSAMATGTGITGNPATITATAVAGSPATIAIVQGGTPQQTAITGNAVVVTPTVVVRDQFTNLVPNRVVSFSASGSGSVGSPAPSTNTDGQASTSWFVDVGGHSMGTNGTFQNTLTATVQGTAISAAFTGFAIYSWGTHVNPLWASSGCTGCHGTPTGSSGLPLANAADVNYDALFNIDPFCDATLVGAGWRRVNTAGGDTGHGFSVLRLLMETTVSTEGACGPHSFAKLSAANLDIVRAWIRNGAPEN